MMTHYQPNIVHQGGQTLIGGLNRVFHCNHYNAHLQMVVRMTKGMPNHDPERLLVDAATPLIQYLQQGGYTQNDLIQEFALCGFGILQQHDENNWCTPHSHYGETTYSHGKPDKSCFFNSGYIQALANQHIEETECQMLGAEQDIYVATGDLSPLENYLTLSMPLKTDLPARFEFDGCQHFNTRVDEAAILAAVQKLPLYGHYDGTGLIDAFGVVLTNHFADYYNRISYETYFAMRHAGLPEEDSKEMFIQSGHICAFNTFGGIMSSPEWHAVIEPMCDNREDWFHGMVAVINALGWGLFRIEKIDVEKELIIRVYNSYEGIGFRRMYPVTDEKNISFLGMGAVLGLVHLLWKVDIREKPTLNQEFYVNQFNNPENRYNVVQTHAIAANDEYDRFVVSKE
jgi:hypothetical protein